MHFRLPNCFCLLILLVAVVTNGFSQIPIIPDSAANLNSDFHFQLTTVSQVHPTFRAPYSGANSLTSDEPTAMTLTATIFWGIQVGKLGEFYLNPEIAGGAGVGSAKGIAGFPNGEAFRVGDPSPAFYFARAYLKHTFNLGGDEIYIGESANQVNKTRTSKYVDLVAGKFSMADYYDKNTYSHDPRSQFLNWALMSGGGWDYPANVRGYTWGVHLEYGRPDWAIRGAVVMVPKEANGNDLDMDIANHHSYTLEVEKSFSVGKRPGVARLLGFYTLAHMGNYDRAVALQPSSPDVTATRTTGNTKYGWLFNVEQEISERIGLFARASWNDGTNETWAFTEIDRSAAIGIVDKVGLFPKNSDEFGLATLINGISQPHRNYLAAGGYGFIIGDGKLNYAGEWATEFYYKVNMFYPGFWLTADYQFVANPAYNQDRGPVHLFALRAHIEL